MDNRIALPIAVVLLLCGMLTRGAAQTVVYSENFETRTSFPEWGTVATDPEYQNPIRTDRTPRGARRYLGQFGAQRVTLQLQNLPMHDTAVVEFDWFIIGSMDGTHLFYGDSFEIAEPTSGFTFCTSFSNFDLPKPETPGRQWYPGACGTSGFPSETGATERSTLGYHYDRAFDAVYHMRLVLTHSTPTFTLAINGDGLQQLYDESWGIDNMTVTVGGRPSGIDAGTSIAFTARPCVSSTIDTLWVRSTGAAPLHIDSATITGNSAPFSIGGPALPLDVLPGDSVPVLVRLSSRPPGTYHATLTLFTNAAPGRFAVDLDATLLPDTPAATVLETSCGLPTYELTDSCGLGSVVLGAGSDNVTIDADPPPPAPSVRTRVRLVDPTRPGRYVLVANGVTVAAGTVDPTSVLDIPASMAATDFGPDGCGTVTLHNRGNAGVWVDAARMRRNLSFSVPPVQLPLWIPPGESRDLMVCYQRTGDADDTLDLRMPCDNASVAFQGLTGPAFTGSGTNCNTTIGFRAAGVTKPVVLARAPVIEPDGSAISVMIEQASPLSAPDVPLSVQVCDMVGRVVGVADPLRPVASVRDGVRSSFRIYRASLGACASGPYLLVIAAPGGPIVRPFVVVR